LMFVYVDFPSDAILLRWQI